MDLYGQFEVHGSGSSWWVFGSVLRSTLNGYGLLLP